IKPGISKVCIYIFIGVVVLVVLFIAYKTFLSGRGGVVVRTGSGVGTSSYDDFSQGPIEFVD
ncbi:MAG: hypothetical protein AAB875_00390, partial [Patescibacteria group bacterium]